MHTWNYFELNVYKQNHDTVESWFFLLDQCLNDLQIIRFSSLLSRVSSSRVSDFFFHIFSFSTLYLYSYEYFYSHNKTARQVVLWYETLRLCSFIHCRYVYKLGWVQQNFFPFVANYLLLNTIQLHNHQQVSNFMQEILDFVPYCKACGIFFFIFLQYLIKLWTPAVPYKLLTSLLSK